MTRVLRFLFAAALLVALPGVAEAQNGTVAGRVTGEDGSAIIGAQVSLAGTGQGGITNARGAFLIVNVPPGSYTLEVQMLGYQTSNVTINVTGGQTVTHNFRLAQTAVAIEGVAVTVGSRRAVTAADELAVPVDVYSRDEIQLATPQLEVATILQELSPAIYFPRPQIADLTSGVRPFQLRGLSPDHSLVLINGKRRHSTAVVHVFGAASGGAGSSGVDMNAIVPSAMGGMEILRDGAAAQYGSDAIAGVINVQLRDDIHAPEFSATVGQYRPQNFDPDGERYEFTGSTGIGLGDRGTLVVSGMFSQRGKTDRAGPDPRDQIVPGDADSIADTNGDGIGEVIQKRNDVTQPNHVIGDGDTKNGGAFVNLNYGLNEDQTHSLYAFGGYTYRRDISSGFFRRGLDNRNWPQIHPLGFLPKFRGDATDFMWVTGVRGFAGEWNYDVSGQWGRNTLSTDIFDTHNVSLGPCTDMQCSNAPGESLAPGPDGILGTSDDPGIPNKTDVYAGRLIANQAVVSVDFNRGVDVGATSPLNVALGVAFRRDNFQMEAGEPASYVNGYHPNRSGGIAAVGSQVFTGFRPDQEVNASRNNVGAYADLELEATDRLLIAAAARFENYSDFGSTVTGKLAARLQASEQFILRGAASTGFRAPNLNQSYYSHVSTGFRTDPNNPGNQVAYEIGEIPVESPEASALGAEPLQEETSVNFSGGLAFTPIERLTFTVDGYLIDVDNRIILTGSLEGPTVERLLANVNAPTVKFFTNAVDTRTKGVDVTGRYRHALAGGRYFEFLAQYNRNSVEVTGVQVPAVIAEIADQVFDSGDEYVLENGRPRDRATLRTRYVQDRFNVGLAGNWYGQQIDRLEEGATPAEDVFLENGPHFVVDADATFQVTEGLRFSIGAENLLNAEPVVVPDGYNFSGIFPFDSSSGLSMNGRYIYTRVQVSF
ncbi:MAG: TonB-dependent receptor [Gemmatimonadota bacterium]